MKISSLLHVSGATAFSRVLGFFRDILMASLLGTSAAADAFFVAFRLPNMFRSIFAEGAFNTSFIPIFTKKYTQENFREALVFASQAFWGMLLILLILTCIAEVFMPWIMHALAPGFSAETQKMAMATHFARMTFPYLIFIALTSLFAALLNTSGRFLASSLMPVVLNCVLITTLLLFYTKRQILGEALSIAVSVAGVCQLSILSVTAYRQGLRLSWIRPRLTPDIKRLMILGFPGVISAGVVQFNLIVGSIIASWQNHAISWLYYADRLAQLPLALIGIAISVVLLPDLSRKLKLKRFEEAHATQNRAIELALILILPAAAGLFILGYDIVRTLFEHHAFLARDTMHTFIALKIYSVALPAFVLIKVLSPSFFAHEDTWRPLLFSIIGVCVNLLISLAFFHRLGYIAVALGSTGAAWTNLSLLWIVAHYRYKFRPDQRLKRKTLKALFCTALFSAILFSSITYFHLQPYAHENLEHKLFQWFSLFGFVLFGTLLYAAIFFLPHALTKKRKK